MLDFKGTTWEKGGSNVNENFKMDAWPQKKGHDIKWLCMTAWGDIGVAWFEEKMTENMLR